MACCCCDRSSGPQRLMRSFLEHRSSRTFSMRCGIAGRTDCSSGCCCCFLGTVACCYGTRFGVASGAFLSRLCWCRWYSCCSSCHARSIAVSPAVFPSTLSLPIWAWNPVYCLIETLCLIVVRAVAKLCCWELIIVLPEAKTFDLFLSSTYKIRRWLKAMSQCSVSLRLPLMERSWKTCCHYGRPVAFHSGPMPLQLNIFGTRLSLCELQVSVLFCHVQFGTVVAVAGCGGRYMFTWTISTWCTFRGRTSFAAHKQNMAIPVV